MKRLHWFRKSEDGYVLVLSLIALPAFMLMALLVIDVARGNNAQSDLQAAADSLALAGAKELDGDTGAIDDAKAAMAQLTNSVSLLEPAGDGISIPLEYADEEGNPFTVIFLSEIPEDDSDPIDQAWVDFNAATGDADANFVYVRAQSRDLLAIFAAVRDTITGSVPVSAEAVATLGPPVACNTPPIYICNPFEDYPTKNWDENKKAFEDLFDSGALYGRLLELRSESTSSAGPGSFGFLRVPGAQGTSDLVEALSIGDSGVCYETSGGVDIEPGVAAEPVERAINSHFGIYPNGGEPQPTPLTRPAINVRMGQSQPPSCSKWTEEGDKLEGMALPTPAAMGPLPGGKISPLPSAAIGPTGETGSWGSYTYSYTYTDENEEEQTATKTVEFFDLYWDITHNDVGYGAASGPGQAPAQDGSGNDVRTKIWASNTFPGPVASRPDIPSRYDTYLYEIANTNWPGNAGLLTDYVKDQSPNLESGIVPQACSPIRPIDLDDYQNYYDYQSGADYTPRRIIIAAVVNCDQANDEGLFPQADDIPVVSLAKMFLTKPALASGNKRIISMEVVDRLEGLGTVADFVRRDTLLVR